MNLKSTIHARERARERFRWNEKVLDKMMLRAFEKGLKHSQCKGNLKKYVSKLYLTYGTANNIRIYGENIFIFKGNLLVTLFRLQSQFIKYLK